MKRLDGFLSEYRTYTTTFRKTAFNFLKAYENIQAGYYTVGEKNEVFCFIGYPKTRAPKGGFPGVVLIHGGSGYAFFEWVQYWTDKGYVAISPDLDGHYAIDEQNRLQENLQGGPHGYGSIHDYTCPCPWLFFSVASILGAVDVLTQQDCVNQDKIVAQGISWGGFTALTATSREKRFKALSVVYSSAFISDSEWGMEQGLKALSSAQRLIYNTDIDPQTYLQEIQAPVFFTAGMDDGAFTVKNRERTAACIRSQKLFSYRKSYVHGHIEGWSEPETSVFFDCVLNGKGMPLLADTEEETIIENVQVQALKWIYTQEDPLQKDICQWQETDDKTQALQNAKAYFVHGTTKEGLQFSSKVYFRGNDE